MSLIYRAFKRIGCRFYWEDADFIEELGETNGDTLLKIVHERIPQGCGPYKAPVSHRFLIVAESGIKPYAARYYLEKESVQSEDAHVQEIVSDIKKAFSQFNFSNEVSVVLKDFC